MYDCFVGLSPEHLSSTEAFLLSNQKTLFFPRDNVIFRGVACLVSSFPPQCVILNLSQCDIKFISRNVPRELHAPIKTNENFFLNF